MNPLIAGFGLAPGENGTFVVTVGDEVLTFPDSWSLVEWLGCARDELISLALHNLQRPHLLH